MKTPDVLDLLLRWMIPVKPAEKDVFKLCYEINGVLIIPSPQKLEDLKYLIGTNQIEPEQAKLYLAGEYNWAKQAANRNVASLKVI